MVKTRIEMTAVGSLAKDGPIDKLEDHPYFEIVSDGSPTVHLDSCNEKEKIIPLFLFSNFKSLSFHIPRDEFTNEDTVSSYDGEFTFEEIEDRFHLFSLSLSSPTDYEKQRFLLEEDPKFWNFTSFFFQHYLESTTSIDFKKSISIHGEDTIYENAVVLILESPRIFNVTFSAI